ncbi:penicillin-binding transpeptidase domain-containing protein [Actinocorallia lasiicapitis]
MASGNSMDKQLRRVAVFGLGLIGVLAINVNYIQGTQADKIKVDDNNTRQYSGIFLRDRGDIISADGVVLASSDPVSDATKPKYQRKYLKDGEVFVPVTGFYAGTFQRSGLELAYSSFLDGLDKSQTVNKWIDQLAGKKPTGANVMTTIDAKAQRVAYQQIKSTNPRRASAIVIEVKTGAIKVAASYPSFDPNTVTNIAKASDDQKVLTQLDADKKGHPLLNKGFAEVFPPGSAFKALVASSFINNGGNENSQVPSPPTENIPGSTFTVKNDCANNDTVLIEAFAQSCNLPFAKMGSDDGLLGNSKVAATARAFGFYEKIQVEDGITAPASVYPTENPAEAFLGSFGQGNTRVTPLQLAMMASAIANDGSMMKPYLVDSVKTRDDDKIYSVDRKSLGKPITGDTAKQMQDLMRAVVQRGTAASAIGGSNLAGKTGTAELGSGLDRGLWFVGFAPANDPKYAFAIQIEGTKGQFGASTSAPPAVAIINALAK